MKIDMYQSTKNSGKWISVPTGTDVSTLKLPDDTDPDLLSLTPVKTEFELEQEDHPIAVNIEDIETKISALGYAIHRTAIKFEEK